MLTQFQTDDRDFQLMQSSWATQLNPLLSIPMNSGVTLKGITLAIGNNVINHRLQRNLQGYIVTDMTGASTQLYRVPSTQPTLTMILNSSAVATIDLWVF